MWIKYYLILRTNFFGYGPKYRSSFSDLILSENIDEKVLFSGDGGDEIFTGYDKYRSIYFLNLLNKLNIFNNSSFNFKNKGTPCLKCFYQSEPSDELLNCDQEGILGPVAGIIGNIQSNEVIKKILNIGKDLNGSILIANLISLKFREVKFNKKNKCICKNY